VNAICPGYVRAGMGVATQSTKAGPMFFLAVPESAGITAQAINVDGGFNQS
jgi:NAD(P)-dependent dehydrogenase (short-subunit alcohol dehydrogenase family)